MKKSHKPIKEIEENIITGFFTMEDDEYFKRDGLSNSSFRLLAESPLHLEHADLFALTGGTFTFGSALHCLVLEPEEFNKRYAVETFEGQDLNKNSNAYKEAKRKWQEEVKGKETLTGKEMEKLEKMARNVKAIAGNLFKDGQAEMAMMCGMDGIQMKGKVDYINHRLKLIIDLKTTGDIKRFGSSAVDYNYVTQASLYTDIAKEITKEDYQFVFVIVDVNSPHLVRIEKASQEMIEIGRGMHQDYIRKWKEWKEEGKADIVKTVQLPKWFLDKYYGEA